MAGDDFNDAADGGKFLFVPGRDDINQGIDLLESLGFVLEKAEFNPALVTKIQFREPGTPRVAVIAYSDSIAFFREPIVVIGNPGTIDPDVAMALSEFVATRGAVAAPKPRAPEGPQP